ncbi:hypothetical protein PG994_002741 [Apiospora phragmitis]|uniref:Uncharacterized protein n=1 Tax=Apiospora phragmitis TaxID=2905665 RepID=A0ABR1W9S4_9PEZI
MTPPSAASVLSSLFSERKALARYLKLNLSLDVEVLLVILVLSAALDAGNTLAGPTAALDIGDVVSVVVAPVLDGLPLAAAAGGDGRLRGRTPRGDGSNAGVGSRAGGAGAGAHTDSLVDV